MSIGWSDLTPDGKKYFEELEKLAKLEVQVGFPSNSGKYEDGATLAEIAAINELGSSTAPSRPFMRQSFENHEDELQDACDEVYTVISDGGTTQQGLEELGAYLVGLVQEEILEGGFAPNAASTIAKKGSEQPLIDSGYMRQSVHFQIKQRT
jgi:hypothetical protein